MIEIDGSVGEAGGQILRTATALSAVKREPCRVFNIRKGRTKPGLQIQHLLGLKALAQLCNGKLEGDYLNSEEIKFYPNQIYQDKIFIDIPTAGSIVLVLQSLILPCFNAPKPVKIIFNGGATDTFFSPTVDYFQHVFLRILERMGGKLKINILKRGFYPEGGARVEVIVSPSKLKSVSVLERGDLKKILIISGASEFLKNKKVAERQIAGVREILGKLKLPVSERVEYYQTQCPGSYICLVAEFDDTLIGTDNLGKLEKRAEEVGKEAALELLKEERSGACFDKHLADQILPYLALSEGKSQISVSEITNHCKANIWVIEKFIQGKFEVKEKLIIWGKSNFP